MRPFEPEADYGRVLRKYYASPAVMYFFLAIALLGGAIFMVALFAGSIQPGEGAKGLEKIPESTLMMCLGVVDFALFFPLFLVCVLTRYFIRRIDLLEARLTEIERRESSNSPTP